MNAAEPTEVVAAVPEAKTEVKEKRKSSLPFFSKRDASPSNGEEKAKGGAFSKLRATIKGKGAAKADEAKEDVAKVEESATETATDAKETTEEAVADVKEVAAKSTEGETENKPEAVAPPAPVVTASA